MRLIDGDISCQAASYHSAEKRIGKRYSIENALLLAKHKSESFRASFSLIDETEKCNESCISSREDGVNVIQSLERRDKLFHRTST